MSQRDRLPYAEHAQQLADGTALYAVQNLTAEDLELFADVLTSKLAVLAIHRMGTTALLAGFEERAERMDQLIRACRYIAQG